LQIYVNTVNVINVIMQIVIDKTIKNCIKILLINYFKTIKIVIKLK